MTRRHLKVFFHFLTLWSSVIIPIIWWVGINVDDILKDKKIKQKTNNNTNRRIIQVFTAIILIKCNLIFNTKLKKKKDIFFDWIIFLQYSTLF